MAGGGGQRQLFSITKEPIRPPPGLALANKFAGLEREEEEEQEFELPEAEYEEGYQPKFEPRPKQVKGNCSMLVMVSNNPSVPTSTAC